MFYIYRERERKERGTPRCLETNKSQPTRLGLFLLGSPAKLFNKNVWQIGHGVVELRLNTQTNRLLLYRKIKMYI